LRYLLLIALAFIFIVGCEDDSPTEPTNIQPGEERVFELNHSINILMVWIPSGSFMMGSMDDEDDRDDDEDQVHDLNIETGFWMGKYEVTQAQWEAVTGKNPSRDYGVGDDYPVYYVSWDNIQDDFLDKLDDGFRIPSEAEWEYACRAGTDTRFYWGNDPDYNEIGSYAVYSANHNDRTEEVGTKLPNTWGLYDMSGNVYEWCADDYHDNYEGAPDDGSPWIDNPRAERRVLRGGTWESNPRGCRSANRNRSLPSLWNLYLGFRLVLDR